MANAARGARGSIAAGDRARRGGTPRRASRSARTLDSEALASRGPARTRVVRVRGGGILASRSRPQLHRRGWRPVGDRLQNQPALGRRSRAVSRPRGRALWTPGAALRTATGSFGIVLSPDASLA